MKKYIVYDKVTDQVLSKYFPENLDACEWDHVHEEDATFAATDVHIFTSNFAAKAAVIALTAAFLQHDPETEIDFKIYNITQQTVYTIDW